MSNTHSYGSTPADFRKGHIVHLHPATDRWMMGDRSGIVSAVGRKFVTVRLTVSGKVMRFTPDLLAHDAFNR
jgi:hypothetical protein